MDAQSSGLRWHSPQERRARLVRGARYTGGAVLLVAALSLIDQWAFQIARGPDSLFGRGWYQALRSVGYLPVWLVPAFAAMKLLPRWRAGRGAAMLVLSPAMAGAGAELLKLVIGRERPTESGAHVWRGLFSGFDNGTGLGLPSSHAAVAFGGAFAGALLVPRLRCLLVTLACGCGATRMLTGDHFLSDVVGGALLGYASARLVGVWLGASGSATGGFGKTW